jgi:hypothetical protein
MNRKEIYHALKDIYQEAVDAEIAQGKPYQKVKENYQSAFEAFQAKERGKDIFFQPLESVSDRVGELYTQL